MSLSDEKQPVALGPDYGVAQNAPKPSVGRIVHFYTRDPVKQSNGQGEGPYPAIVLQVHGPYVNLKIWSWDAGYVAGSVSHAAEAKERGYACWWEWPPKV